MALTEAINALRNGSFVLVHDDKGRENEVDMVISAERIKPEHVGLMRTQAGGLLCLAISHDIATRLGLVYLHDIIEGMGKLNPVYSRITQGKAAYGDKPSFSIPVNHRDTFTGITDRDRALTISQMAMVCKNIESTGKEDFARNFRAPGHVPILIASKGLLHERMGHTELCVYLMQLAGLTPCVAICEMMDSETHGSLGIDKAGDFAKKYSIPLVESEELKANARVQ